ncbi:MAG: hypothetical protein ACR2QE_21270 [Acidimicrobiales bacterium]
MPRTRSTTLTMGLATVVITLAAVLAPAAAHGEESAGARQHNNDPFGPNTLLVSNVSLDSRWVSGRLTCTEPADVRLGAEVWQFSDGGARADGTDLVHCDGQVDFAVPMRGYAGRFDDGRAAFELTARSVPPDPTSLSFWHGSRVIAAETPLSEEVRREDGVAIDSMAVVGADLEAEARVRIDCETQTMASVFVEVRQNLGDKMGLFTTHADPVPCDGIRSVNLPLRGYSMVFKPGEAEVYVSVTEQSRPRALLRTNIEISERIRPHTIITERQANSRLKIGRAADGVVRVLVDCGSTLRPTNVAIAAGQQQGRLVTVYSDEVFRTNCQGPTLFRFELPDAEPGTRLYVAAVASARGDGAPDFAWQSRQEAGRRMR